MRLFLVMIIVCVTVLSGCTAQPTELEQSQTVFEALMSEVYLIENHENIVSENDYYQYNLCESAKTLEVYAMFTEFGFREFRGIRYIYRFLKAAAVGETNVRLLRVQYANVYDESIDGKIFFDYAAELELTHLDGSIEVFEKKGKVKLLKEEDGWKIDHIKEVTFPFRDLYMETQLQ